MPNATFEPKPCECGAPWVSSEKIAGMKETYKIKWLCKNGHMEFQTGDQLF